MQKPKQKNTGILVALATLVLTGLVATQVRFRPAVHKQRMNKVWPDMSGRGRGFNNVPFEDTLTVLQVGGRGRTQTSGGR